MWEVVLAALISFSVPDTVGRTPLIVESADGVRLRVVEYRRHPERHRPTIIITGHGTAGSTTPQIDRLAETLFVRGLDVVVWDRRGTAGSTGLWDHGRSDAEDLRHVIEAVDRRSFGSKLGLIGIGNGGEAALLAAARTTKARAVAVYGVGIHGVREAPSGPWASLTDPHGTAGRWLMRLRGVRPDPSIPARESPPDLTAAARRLHRRPVMVAAGRHDTRVGVGEARELFDAARPPKEWALAPDADERPPLRQWAPQLEDFFLRKIGQAGR